MRLSEGLSILFAAGWAAAGCAPSLPTPPVTAGPHGAGVDARAPGEPARDVPAPAPGPEAAAADAATRPWTEGGPPERLDATADATHAGAEVAPAAPAPERGQVVIDEVLVDPAGTDLGREWIEIASLADHAVDLRGLHLSDGTTDVPVDGGLLPARGRLVLGQSSDPARNGGAPVAAAYGTRLMLNNAGDVVQLCLGACAGGDVLDVLAWDASLGAAYAGRALVVDPGSRAICPASEPFGNGGSLGSPGLPNPPCGVAAGDAGSGPEIGPETGMATRG
jgi:hypothetical protein